MRNEDWPEKLNDYLMQPHEFDWATKNCGFFAFGGVEAMTGKDLVSAYRGPKTKRGILSRMHKVCGGDVETLMKKEIGEPLSAILLAKRGDIVSFDFGVGPALGLCIGAQAVFLSETDGVIKVPLNECRFAWGVE